MCSDDHALTALQTRQNSFIPVRDHAVNGQRQAFRQRQFFLAQFRVTRIVTRITLIIFSQFRRSHCKTTTPLFHLLVAILFSSFRFVQTLQRTVVTFVQFPGFLNGQPCLIQFVQHIPQGMDSAFQHRSVSKVKAVTFLFQQLTCCFCFAYAFLRQIHVVPTGETVFFVPLTFAMTNQNQLSYSHILTPQIIF